MKDSESRDQHGFHPNIQVRLTIGKRSLSDSTLVVVFDTTFKHPVIYSVFSFAVTNQCPPRALDCDENLAPDKQLTLDDASAS